MGLDSTTDDPRERSATAGRPVTRRSALTRRTLLAGGLVGAGGIAGLLGADPAAATASPGPVVYGPSPSPTPGDDDTPALQAAMTAFSAGGTVLLPPGAYQLRSLLYVPTKVDLVGSGGGYAGPATTLQCLTPGAGIHVWGGGGTTGDFVVDGTGVATAPFMRGYEGSAVGRTFAALSVLNSAQDGVTCLGSQNDAWYLLTVQNAARDCLVLDQGYGGALFSKCEFATSGRFNLRIDTQIGGGPYGAPSDNVFHQCIVEYNSPGSQSIAYINGGWANKFDHTSFFASNKTTGPVIDVTGGATEVVFQDAAIQSPGTTIGGIGLRVDYGTGVSLAGNTHFQNFDTAIYVRRSSGSPAASPWVDIQGLPLYYYCTNQVGADPAALVPGQGIDYLVGNFQFHAVQARRSLSTDLAYISRIGSAPYDAVTETAEGRRAWGTGLTPGGDVSLARRSAGVLSVDPANLFATGYGTTASRQAPAAAGSGAIRLNTDSSRLEVCDGTAWYAPAEHTVTFTSSGAFAVPAGVTAIRCRALGGGGGGGGGGNIGAASRANSCYGGAGGGAGMLLEQILAVTPGETLTITVGSGGAGGAGAAAAHGSIGFAGSLGGPGTTTIVARSSAALVQAPGGGGGAGGPGSTYTAAVAPTSGGAYGCADLSMYVAPGCGSFAGHGVVPSAGGICGGASGASSTATLGGSTGTAPTAPGQRGTPGTASSPTKTGQTGAVPSAVGCGGNGGGAGGKGAAGGAGGSGSAGQVDLWWVA